MRGTVVAVLISAAMAGHVGAEEPPSPGRQALLEELGRGRVARHSETGLLRFASGSASRPSASSARLGRPASAREAALAYAARYGTLFGLAEARGGVRVERSVAAGKDRAFVRLQQVHAGVPVLAGELTLQVDADGNVISALGEFSPARAIELDARVAARQAERTALAFSERSNRAARGQLRASQPELWIFDPALVGPAKVPGVRLVWKFDVRDDAGTVSDFVLVDAQTGSVALRFSQIAHAKSRYVCDANSSDAHYPCSSPVRTEGDPPAGTADVDAAYDYAGHTYDFFQNRFGRDSIDDSGSSLVATVNHCPWEGCAQPNAFWDGFQATFSPGMAADDVVAHEFAHGFTQHTSGLFYYYQSGAINEAISDIFGEFVDLTNGAGTDTATERWLMGEDTVVGPIRNMSSPSASPFLDPDRMRSSLYWSRDHWDWDYDNGGVHVNSGIANKAAYLMVDGGSFNGQSVAAIGIDKTAAIWYRVATHYLASGSDFEDLGNALNQACTDLINTSVKDGAGVASGTVAATDCTQVGKAVLATEMALQPTVAGAAAPEAPVCASGTAADVFVDQISEAAPGWSVGGDPDVWAYGDMYATSSPWHLWSITPGAKTDARLRRVAAVTLPVNAYLHFRHAHMLDSWEGTNYDGGRVEYELDNSGTWLDARPLFTHNGYNGTVSDDVGSIWENGRAFVGYSKGYISSRIDLSGLAGRAFRFRFRTATNDDPIGDYGWFIDDVRLYTCSGGSGGDTTAPSVTPPNADFRTGVAVGGKKPVKLRVSFTASDDTALARTRLQKRANSGTYSKITLSSATATSANQAFPTSFKTKRQFRARATDTSGNTSAWATADPFRVLAHQNGSAAVTQSGSWSNGSNSNFYGGSVRHSTSAGASQSRTATASDYAVVSTLGPNRGKADVYVDGVFQTTIDLYASTIQYKRVVYAIDFGSPGTHTIELRVKGTKNASSSGTRVDFDAFLSLTP